MSLFSKMSLRTYILVTLFLFATTPLLIAVFVNVPLVLSRMELFYHKAYMQNLRADFRDLDQHLASRNELLRMMTKLPEPGTMWQNETDSAKIKQARLRYTRWLNRMLGDQQDVVELLFISTNQKNIFWVTRNKINGLFETTNSSPLLPIDEMLEEVVQMRHPGVLVSPIRLEKEQNDLRKRMTLQLLSPIFLTPNQPLSGIAIMTLDVGGIARAFPNSIWLRQNGGYMNPTPQKQNGFKDFTGLEQLFKTPKMGLWKGDNGAQAIWVPILQTEKEGPIWVGRMVDSSPLRQFKDEITFRVLMVLGLITIIVLLLSHWLAQKLVHFNYKITTGVRGMLAQEKNVSFNWKKPPELKQLATDLNLLSEKHQANLTSLQDHAAALEQSNRYKSEFLANVSHELRTPLNSILLLSKLLNKESSLGSKHQKQAKVIHQAGQDLLTLINNVLDLSRLEAGKAVINIEQIELTALIQEAIELIQPQFEQKKLKLLFSHPESLVWIESDGFKIRQILNNFLSNALKFTESGGQVRIKLEKNDKSVLINIIDTGIGIIKEKQDLIFDAFQQVDGSTNRRYGGTGLGLNISRQFAHLLGGKIQLSSEVNQGSNFSLSLPLKFNPHNISSQVIDLKYKIPIKKTAKKQDEKPTIQLNFHKALIISHHISDMLTLTPFLEDMNISVHGAGDIEEVMETLQSETDFDLFIIDITLSSLEDCANIKLLENQQIANQSIVGILERQNLTQQSLQIKECKEKGLSFFIERPIDTQQLLVQLQKHEISKL